MTKYKVLFKNEEDRTDSRLKKIRDFLEICVNEPSKESKRKPLERALQELFGKGTTTIAKHIWTLEEIFGSLKEFQPNKYFEIITKLE